MKFIYRISMSDGQEYIKHYDDIDIKEIRKYIEYMRWISINEHLSISIHHIVSIECIATSNKGIATILRDGEHTIRQLNKYLKDIKK